MKERLDNQCDEVLEFIERRFYKDCNWLDGNCYYFALILKDRFPDGKIYYDVLNGHFVYKYKGLYYDWVGIYEPECDDDMVSWNQFRWYDSSQKDIIIRDCVM